MIPLIVTGAVSLANAALDAWNQAAEAKKAAAPQQLSPVKFDELLQKSGAYRPLSYQSEQILMKERMDELTRKLMQSPEMQAALAGKAPSQDAGVCIDANGSVSVATAGGGRQNLILTPETRAIARQLQAMIGALNQSGRNLQAGGMSRAVIQGV